MKKNPELLRKWADVLESGEYVQTVNRLRDDEGFCCFGVYCDAFVNGAWVVNEGGYHFRYRRGELHGVMPKHERLKIGLNVEEENRLTNMNDGGAPFPEIAAVLRRWADEAEGAEAERT